MEVVLREEVHVPVQEHGVGGHGIYYASVQIKIPCIVHHLPDERHVHQGLASVEADICQRFFRIGTVRSPHGCQTVHEGTDLLKGHILGFALIVSGVKFTVSAVPAPQVAVIRDLECQLAEIDKVVFYLLGCYPSVVHNCLFQLSLRDTDISHPFKNVDFLYHSSGRILDIC